MPGREQSQRPENGQTKTRLLVGLGIAATVAFISSVVAAIEFKSRVDQQFLGLSNDIMHEREVMDIRFRAIQESLQRLEKKIK